MSTVSIATWIDQPPTEKSIKGDQYVRKLKINVKLNKLNADLILKKGKMNILDIDINFKNPFILNLSEKRNYILNYKLDALKQIS